MADAEHRTNISYLYMPTDQSKHLVKILKQHLRVLDL
jgi:hypothetical protein